MNELKKLTGRELVSNFKKLIESERKLTAEIVEYIKEIDSRKLYVELGYSSLFLFLTEEMGYTPASAQRRIDSARLLRDLPELKKEISSGSVNLSQLSVIAQSVRQKEKESAVSITAVDKKEILNQIRNQSLAETQQAVAEFFDIQPIAHEKTLHQADKSVRIEMTLNEKQMKLFNRVKDLLGATLGCPQVNEVLEYLCQDFLKRKDPVIVQERIQNRNAARAVTSKSEVPPSQSVGAESGSEVSSRKSLEVKTRSRQRIPISSAIKREVFSRDMCCRWVDLKTEIVCGSRVHLEIDHRQPIWAGGTNSIENLQVLCRAHNQLKYRFETRTIYRPSS